MDQRFAVQLLAIVIMGFVSHSCSNAEEAYVTQTDEIQPFHTNPSFWQYKGEPVLLLGASSDHNMFQFAANDLLHELNKLVEDGGNYLRNTLSFRGPKDLFAYHRDPETGLFELSRFNDEYWQKLDFFLNETQAEPKWSIYWAEYIGKVAKEKEKNIYLTEMFDPFDPTNGAVEGAKMQSPATHFFTQRSNVNLTLDNPDIFTFVDISNHNAQVGEVHYNTGLYVWKRIQESGKIRPLNNVKIYGADGGSWNGSSEDGKQRF